MQDAREDFYELLADKLYNFSIYNWLCAVQNPTEERLRQALLTTNPDVVKQMHTLS